MQRRSQLASLSLVAALLAACGGGSNVDGTAPRTAGLRLGADGPTAPPTASAHSALIQMLYLAYYGRVADSGGLSFWTTAFDNFNLPTTASGLFNAYSSDANVKMVLDAFSLSAEASDLYAGTDDEFVNTVYINLFSRYADVGGRQYWASALDKHVITRPFAALAISIGAQGDDQLTLAKKSEVATRFLAALASASLADTSPKGVVGADLLAQVNATTDLAAFQTEIDAAVQSISQDITPTTVLRYTAFQNVYSEITTPARYWLSYGRGTIPAPSGKLVFGLGERQIGFANAAGSSSPVVAYDAPIVASSSVSAKVDGTAPVMLMLCQAVTDAAAGTSNRSTDLLVLNAAQMITSAKELVGQTLSTYREDCGVVTTQSIVFDAKGAATVTDASGNRTYPFASVQAALNGVLTGGLLEKDLSWRAYRYTTAGGSTRYAVVSRTVSHVAVSPLTPSFTASGPARTGANATAAVGALALWSQE